MNLNISQIAFNGHTFNHLRVSTCVDNKFAALLELFAAYHAIEFLNFDRTHMCDEGFFREKFLVCAGERERKEQFCS